jgi:hypothetical protein
MIAPYSTCQPSSLNSPNRHKPKAAPTLENTMTHIPAELRQAIADGFFPDDAGTHLVRRDTTPPYAEYDAAAREIERQARETGVPLASLWRALSTH